MARKSSSELTANLSTKISAVLRGNERGILVLGSLFLSLTVAGLYFGSVLSEASGIGGMVTLLICWLLYGGQIPADDGYPVAIQNKDTQITTVVKRPGQALTIFRAFLQNRHEFPSPHGSVIGDPRESHNLHPYTEDEKERVTRELRESIEMQEQKSLQQIKGILQPQISQTISAAGEPPVQMPFKSSPDDKP